MTVFDIITFGSASRDIVVRLHKLKVVKHRENLKQGEGFYLPVGSKIEVKDIQFFTGGGGTNTAAAFALQGFKTAFWGAVGQDSAGQEIIDELKKLKVGTIFIVRKGEKPTNQSIIILQGILDRTILSYRGASDLYNRKDIPFGKLKTEWIYLAPMGGLLCDSCESIVSFASKNSIKVALNPSMEQLSLKNFPKIAKKVDVLFLNKDEASLLAKTPFSKEKEIFKKIDKMCPGVAVMTRGGEGVTVSDGEYLYSASPHPKRKIVDTTGAGDSFASGFLTGFIRHNGNIERAIQLGMANSEGNISKFGAKTGLLKKDQKFNRVRVTKKVISQ